MYVGCVDIVLDMFWPTKKSQEVQQSWRLSINNPSLDAALKVCVFPFPVTVQGEKLGEFFDTLRPLQ